VYGLAVGTNIGDVSDRERIRRNGRFSLRQPIFPIHVTARLGDWVSVRNHYRALVLTQCVCECKCVQYENSSKNFFKL